MKSVNLVQSCIFLKQTLYVSSLYIYYIHVVLYASKTQLHGSLSFLFQSPKCMVNDLYDVDVFHP